MKTRYKPTFPAHPVIWQAQYARSDRSCNEEVPGGAGRTPAASVIGDSNQRASAKAGAVQLGDTQEDGQGSCHRQHGLVIEAAKGWAEPISFH